MSPITLDEAKAALDHAMDVRDKGIPCPCGCSNHAVREAIRVLRSLGY